ncbi:hypothetical protein GCM10010233_61170 [Streptomyces pseudogriseolus]|nr:hypothetical protein GCM10010233_61170 [Streptomyces gancidicus]
MPPAPRRPSSGIGPIPRGSSSCNGPAPLPVRPVTSSPLNSVPVPSVTPTTRGPSSTTDGTLHRHARQPQVTLCTHMVKHRQPNGRWSATVERQLARNPELWNEGIGE